MTDEQRAAAQPWAIAAFAAEPLQIIPALVYWIATESADTRWFGVCISLSWLATRGFQRLCLRQIEKIVGISPLPPRTSFNLTRSTFVLILVILAASVISLLF